MLGAILLEEFRCLAALTRDAPRQQVLLSGLPHLQPAWTFALENHGFSVRKLNAEETERCFLAGMFRIFEQRSPILPNFPSKLRLSFVPRFEAEEALEFLANEGLTPLLASNSR